MTRAAGMSKQTILCRLLQTQFRGRFQYLVESIIDEAPHLLQRCKINRKTARIRGERHRVREKNSNGERRIGLGRSYDRTPINRESPGHDVRYRASR